MSSYFYFFNRFRSSPDVVKQHQSIFLKYFKGCGHVVDIGCGRGEFLELLKEMASDTKVSTSTAGWWTIAGRMASM